MPFEHDVSLVAQALELIRSDKVGWQKRDRLNGLIEELRTEAKLANGRVPERSEHWRHRALVTQRKLRQEVEER